MLTHAEILALLRRDKRRRKPVRNGIKAGEHHGLVGYVVRRMLRPGDDRDELFNAGWLGLRHAARFYDPARGARFSTYAVPCIVGHILRFRQLEARFRRPRWTWRGEERSARVWLYSELGRRRFGRLGNLFAGGNADLFARDDPDLAAAAGRPDLGPLLDALTPRRRRVLELLYGLNGHRRHTYREAGKVMGITGGRVGQIEQYAVRKLRDRAPDLPVLREVVAEQRRFEAERAEIARKKEQPR